VSVTGLHNLISKSLGSTNKVNIAYATVEALSTLVARDKWLNAKPRTEKTEKVEKAPAKLAKAEVEVKEAPKKAPAKKVAAKKVEK